MTVDSPIAQRPALRTGARLLIRNAQPADRQRLREIWRDPQVMRYTTSPAMTREQAINAANAWVDGTNEYVRHTYRLGIVRREDEVFVGTFGMDLERFATGYIHSMYLHRKWWDLGLATEALQLLVDFAFDELNLHRVWVACGIHNTRANRLADRIGFTRVGTIPQYFSRGDTWCDSYMHTYLADEWRGGGRGLLGSSGRWDGG